MPSTKIQYFVCQRYYIYIFEIETLLYGMEWGHLFHDDGGK